MGVLHGLGDEARRDVMPNQPWCASPATPKIRGEKGGERLDTLGASA